MSLLITFIIGERYSFEPNIYQYRGPLNGNIYISYSFPFYIQRVDKTHIWKEQMRFGLQVCNLTWIKFKVSKNVNVPWLLYFGLRPKCDLKFVELYFLFPCRSFLIYFLNLIFGYLDISVILYKLQVNFENFICNWKLIFVSQRRNTFHAKIRGIFWHFVPLSNLYAQCNVVCTLFHIILKILRLINRIKRVIWQMELLYVYFIRNSYSQQIESHKQLNDSEEISFMWKFQNFA